MSARRPPDLDGLPGAELALRGLADLERGVVSQEALLLLIAESRLTAAGLVIPPPPHPLDPNEALYLMLAAEHGDEAHSRYNALIRRIVSLEHALECAS